MHKEKKCFTNITDTISLLKSLSVTVHADKSQFLPTPKLDVLGFTINSVKMMVSLKKEKRKQLASLITITFKKKFINIRNKKTS